MKFWKEHTTLRVVLIAVFFVLGLALTFYGWSMTGKLVGLGLMLLGIVFLLAALLIYNKPYSGRSR